MKEILTAILLPLFLFPVLLSCDSGSGAAHSEKKKEILPGDAQVGIYLPMLRGKRVALLANHTARIGERHLLDTLLSSGVEVVKIFSPEHGFRGQADAGAHVAGGVDKETGIPVISLYGDHRKPTHKDLEGVDILVFDIQDVGVRFYTYISTMSYAMDACANEKIPFLILDRPNPNGNYIDGPLMDSACRSFIGLHAGVPVVHGMTVGEYAQMVNEEGWLQGGVKVDLEVIPIKNWTHATTWRLPVRPSPNLPNMKSIYLYPTLCFFEATVMSVGRGTDKPFQVVGHPDFPGEFEFTPHPLPGAMHPKLEGQLCRGIDFPVYPEDSLRAMGRIRLDWILDVYHKFPDKSNFFLSHFYKLAGNYELQKQIEAGLSEAEIRVTWQSGLDQFRSLRSKYLLYP